MHETREDDLITQAVRNAPVAIVLTDPRLDDNPITYVNRAFETMTLYSREFAIGRNCRFLQGPETDQKEIDDFVEGIRSGKEFQVTISNHKADGSIFRNHVLVSPIYDDTGELAAYFGVQRETEMSNSNGPDGPGGGGLELLQELQHRVKNHLAMIVSMIRVQASREVTPESLKAVSRRIEALALLYELVGANGNGNGSREIAAGAYLSRIASVVAGLETRSAIRVNIECDDITLPVEQAARLGLLLSEFLTNALQHAFRGRSSGAVDVCFSRQSDGTVRLSVKDDGCGLPEGSNWPFGAPSIETQHERAEHDEGELDTTAHGREPGVGGSIVAALTESLGADLDVKSSEVGTVVAVSFDPGAPPPHG